MTDPAPQPALVLNCTPRPSLAGLTCDGLIAAAARVARSVSAWDEPAVYRYSVPQAREKVATAVRVGRRAEGNDYWVARVNCFRELDAAGRRALFHHLMRYSIGSVSDLAQCHTEYERQYIPELVRSALAPVLLAGAPAEYECFSYLAALHYKLQWPLTRRRFCNLVLVARHRLGNSAYVISVAVAPAVASGPDSPLVDAPDSPLVDAQYSAVEHVEYDPQADTLQWTMATCSDAKGSVPHWLARMSMNSVVAKDVEHFLEWVSSK